MLWIWRMAAATIGTWGYYRLQRPDWRNRFLLLYDVPTLPVASAFAGESLALFLAGAREQAGIRLVSLLIAVGLAAGAQYRAWPLSGHLTVALPVGLLESADARNPALWRGFVWLPVLLLLWIRTFHPQSELMGNRRNTLSALVLGALLGCGALLSSPWR